jgi:hypothetical protein
LINSISGLVILERNYLEIYVFDKWEGNQLPSFEEGDRFVPDECEMKEGKTTRPNLLTEADLVNLMDKNGIGQSFSISCVRYVTKWIPRKNRNRCYHSGTYFKNYRERICFTQNGREDQISYSFYVGNRFDKRL